MALLIFGLDRHIGSAEAWLTTFRAHLPQLPVRIWPEVGNAKEIAYRDLTYDSNVAKVSIIGIGMRAHPGVAKTMFRTLSDKGINIQVISTSEIKVSASAVQPLGGANPAPGASRDDVVVVLGPDVAVG